jgi:hypothetical protein
VFPVQGDKLAGILDLIFLKAASTSVMLLCIFDGSNESSSPIHSKYALRGHQLRLPAIALNPASAYEIPPQVTAGWLSLQHIEDRTFTYTTIKLLRFGYHYIRGSVIRLEIYYKLLTFPVSLTTFEYNYSLASRYWYCYLLAFSLSRIDFKMS